MSLPCSFSTSPTRKSVAARSRCQFGLLESCKASFWMMTRALVKAACASVSLPCSFNTLPIRAWATARSCCQPVWRGVCSASFWLTARDLVKAACASIRLPCICNPSPSKHSTLISAGGSDRELIRFKMPCAVSTRSFALRWLFSAQVRTIRIQTSARLLPSWRFSISLSAAAKAY